MDNKHAHGGGNGFLFGVLIGILIALLFTTKKGRKILKNLTDEGMDKFTSLEDLLEKRLKEEDSDDMGLGDTGAKREMQPVPAAPVTTHHPHTEHTHQTEAHLYSHHYPPQQVTEVPAPVHEHHHEPVHHHQTHTHSEEAVDTRLEDFVQQMHEPEVPSYSRPVTANRRFFRGIPKRSSN